jgi:hypothetical protein
MSNIPYPPYPASPEPQGARPFGDIPSLWLKIFKMDETWFAQEAPRASSSNTLISLVIYAIISGILGGLVWLVNRGIYSGMMSRYGGGNFGQGGFGGVVCGLCLGIFGTLLGFYLANGLTFLGAKVLGGTGSFTPQTYLVSLFTIPIGILASLVSLIPCLGALVALALSIYALILNVRVIKVVHNLTTGKAIVAVLWIVVVALLIGCCVAVSLLMLGPAVGNVFSNIIQNVGPTP